MNQNIHNIKGIIMRRILIFTVYLVLFVNTTYCQYVADSTLLLSRNDMQW